MLIYIIFLVLLFTFWRIKLNAKQGSIILGLYLVIMLSLRNWNMGLNDTRNVYLPLFNSLNGASFSDLGNVRTVVFEPLWLLFVWIISNIFEYYIVFIFITSAFSVITVLYFLYRIKNKYVNIYFEILVYFCFFYFYNFYLIKQMFALGFLLIGILLLRKDKNLQGIIFFVIGSLIHKSAWVCLPIFFLCKYLRIKKSALIITFVLIAIGYFFPEQILNLIYMLDFSHTLRSYLMNGVYTRGSGTLSIPKSLAILIFAIISRKQVDNRYKSSYDSLIALCAFGAVMDSYSFIVEEFYRVALYFNIIDCYLLPFSSKIISKRYKNAVTVLVCAFVIIISFTSTIPNTGCESYHTIFSTY